MQSMGSRSQPAQRSSVLAWLGFISASQLQIMLDSQLEGGLYAAAVLGREGAYSILEV